jgi:hypothetical protein
MALPESMLVDCLVMRRSLPQVMAIMGMTPLLNGVGSNHLGNATCQLLPLRLAAGSAGLEPYLPLLSMYL